MSPNLISSSLASKWALNRPIWSHCWHPAYALVEFLGKFSTIVAQWRSLEYRVSLEWIEEIGAVLVCQFSWKSKTFSLFTQQYRFRFSWTVVLRGWKGFQDRSDWTAVLPMTLFQWVCLLDQSMSLLLLSIAVLSTGSISVKASLPFCNALPSLEDCIPCLDSEGKFNGKAVLSAVNEDLIFGHAFSPILRTKSTKC
mmetsp:Transcript_18077/g.32771  ORF Transcript_18077/g.32771 Transcript_18077/m.32771 type:complete len:197 (+) Transcript_18077:435-1025(+)